MTIMKFPVCPFCNTALTNEGVKYIMPTKTSGMYVVTDVTKDMMTKIMVKSVDEDYPPRGIDNSENLIVWKCLGCGFVALWSGAVK
ncbi:MAG: hypothetical protein V1850_00335 [Candidatus Bathyarchaeota archaeon]